MRIFTQPWPAWLPVRLKRYFETFYCMAKQGHLKSALRGECVDGFGDPIPWWSYPAIALFRQMNLADLKILEWGSGNSTRFFLSQGAHVMSIEHDMEWFGKIDPLIGKNPKCIYRLDYGIGSYCDPFHGRSYTTDIAVIDGRIHHQIDTRIPIRYLCAKTALRVLNPNGIIVLDNSDWLPATRRLLHDSGFTEIPFVGQAPLVPYATTTSVYVRNINDLADLLFQRPSPPVGSLVRDYEDPYYGG